MTTTLHPGGQIRNKAVQQEEWEFSCLIYCGIFRYQGLKADQLPHTPTASAFISAIQMAIVAEKVETHVNFTPHKLVAFFITALITSEDISWPPALEGKLYSNRGICHFMSNDTYSAL